MAEKSKVYFADFRAPSWRENLPQKLARLMMTAGFGDIDMDGKYVAIKMHSVSYTHLDVYKRQPISTSTTKQKDCGQAAVPVYTGVGRFMHPDTPYKLPKAAASVSGVQSQ